MKYTIITYIQRGKICRKEKKKRKRQERLSQNM